MNAVSISISGIFAILAVAFAVLLLVAILANQKTARRYREQLNAKLSSLRLSRMLAFHRINQGSYLHTQPVVDIEKQMKRCASCTQTQRCEEVLAADSQAETGFCANDGDLKDIKRKVGAAA
jgi:hypothetical protein